MLTGGTSRRHPVTRVTGAGPVQRSLTRVAAQIVYLGSALLGDDWLGRRLRGLLLRAAGATLGSGASVHGGSHLTVPSRLTLGRDVFVNRSCYFDLDAPVIVGDGATVGHGCTFVTTHHHIGPPERRCGDHVAEPIVIGPGAWLGANVTVLAGVTVGAGAVVAAGAVVREDVAPNTMVGGVPARLIRVLDGPGRTAPSLD